MNRLIPILALSLSVLGDSVSPYERVTLKEYIEQQLAAERAVRETQRTDDQRALDVATESLSLRLDGMNELRAQILAERGTFVTRDVFDRTVNMVDDRMRILENARANTDGRMYVMGGILLFVQMLSMVGFGVFMRQHPTRETT